MRRGKVGRKGRGVEGKERRGDGGKEEGERERVGEECTEGQWWCFLASSGPAF